MAVSALTAQLPALAGALPDLFRRNDSAPIRGDESHAAASTASDASTTDEQRAMTARNSDDTTRLLARRAALGPLTYGRRALPVDAPAAAPIGMRGVHLDVRG
ncbi:MAG: hypothetical protein H7099_11975 [Gemmatimonadaceae bacterium]|nr:hypothetical protein [Gemmatimonadaceae bacterium]